MPATPTTPQTITANVVASFDGAPQRLRDILQSLTRHLHAFAVEVGLTSDEWERAIGILTETGHITDAKRQEFILWSDALGLSMLVYVLAHPLPAAATESTVLGPFYVPGAPLREYGASIAVHDAGVPAWVHGRVTSVGGEPIAAPSWTSGKTARTASTRCRTARSTRRTSGDDFARATTEATPSSRSGRYRTPFPATDRSGRC